MVLEQLDLFGNPVYITSSGKVLSAPPTPEMELAEVGDETNAVVTKKGLSSERSKNKKAVHTMEKNLENESRVAANKETNNNVQLQEMALDNQVVYSDNQIRVRIKLKPAATVVPDSKPEEPINIEQSEIEEQKQLTELPAAIEAIQQEAQPKAIVASPFDTIASTLTVPKAPLLTNPFSSIVETAELIPADNTSNLMDAPPALETEWPVNPIAAEELASETAIPTIEDSEIVAAPAMPETALNPIITSENIIEATPALSLEEEDIEIPSEIVPSEEETIVAIDHQLAAEEESLVPETELGSLPIVEKIVEEVTQANTDAEEKLTDVETILTEEKIVEEIVAPMEVEATTVHEVLTESAPVEEHLPVEIAALDEAQEPALDLQSVSLDQPMVSEIANPGVVKEEEEEAFATTEQISTVAAIAVDDVDLSATITSPNDIELPITSETASETEPSETKTDFETNKSAPLIGETPIEVDAFPQKVTLPSDAQNEETNLVTEAIIFPATVAASPLSIHAEQPNTKENMVLENSSSTNLTNEILSSSIHVALPNISNNLHNRNEQPISDSEHIVQAFIPDTAPDAAIADKFPINEHELAAQTAPKRGRRSYKAVEISSDLVNIPDDETLQKKLYYGIGEVAEWFGVNTSQIRFWENEFDVLQPRKTKKGDRLFRVEDIKNLQLIHHLLRNRKFSLEGAKDYLKANKQHADLHFELTQSLTKFRSFLLELKASLGV